ncbi:MAG: site-2 protease family protein [Phycisphaerales bacterium]|nr:site-2 protease family protein [Phycisphaerales bacterium]
MNWWVADLYQSSPALLVSWAFWIIFSITLHELAHGWAALRAGDDTPRVTGHMTWNPLVHMGMTSLVMFAIVGIAWGAMPVKPSNFRGRHDDAKVAAAGPAMNLGLGLTACVLAAAWFFIGPRVAPQHLDDNVAMFFLVGAAANLALMILNLMPFPPLDGSRVIASFVPSYRNLIYSDQGPMIALFGLIIVFYALGGRVFEWSIAAAHFIIGFLVQTFGPSVVP